MDSGGLVIVVLAVNVLVGARLLRFARRQLLYGPSLDRPRRLTLAAISVAVFLGLLAALWYGVQTCVQPGPGAWLLVGSLVGAIVLPTLALWLIKPPVTMTWTVASLAVGSILSFVVVYAAYWALIAATCPGLP